MGDTHTKNDTPTPNYKSQQRGRGRPGEVSRGWGGGAPPFPGPPPPRSPGGLQPCFSVSEAGDGGDGVPYTPPYRGRTGGGGGWGWAGAAPLRSGGDTFTFVFLMAEPGVPNLGGGDGDSPVRSPPSAGTQRTGMRGGTLPGHTLQATRGGLPASSGVQRRLEVGLAWEGGIPVFLHHGDAAG